MLIPYLIGFMIGVIFTLLVGSYAISLSYENEIKKDVLVQELLEENRKYQKHYEAASDMNKDYWG